VLVITRIEGDFASASAASSTEFYPPITRTRLAARRRRKTPLAVTATASTVVSTVSNETAAVTATATSTARTDTIPATNNDDAAVASGNRNEVAAVGHMHMHAYKNSATSVVLDIDNTAADTTTTIDPILDQVQSQHANKAQQRPRSIYRIAEKTSQEKVTGAASLSRTAAVAIPILQSDNREIIGPDKEKKKEKDSSTMTTTVSSNDNISTSSRDYPVIQKINARIQKNQLNAMAEASALMKMTRAGVEENDSMAMDKELAAVTNTLLYNSFSMTPVAPPSQMTQTSGSSSSIATGGYVPVANPTENNGPPKRPSISSSVVVSNSNNNNNILPNGGGGGGDAGNNSNSNINSSNSSPASSSTTPGSDNSGAGSAVVEVAFDPDSFPDNNGNDLVNGDKITMVEERLDNVDTSTTAPAVEEQPSSTNTTTTTTTTSTEQTQTSSTPPTSSPLSIGITADLPEGNDDWVLSTNNNTNAQGEDGASTAAFLLWTSTSFGFSTTATMLGLTLSFIC